MIQQLYHLCRLLNYIAELYYGAEKSQNSGKNHNLIDEFLLTIETIYTDGDIFIAATAYVKAEKLITGSEKHFQRFPNLVVENWK